MAGQRPHRGEFDETSENWLNDAAFSTLVIQLTGYGLTLNEARVYLYLLRAGSSPARGISKSLGLHRVEVYRKLRALEELGLVELYLDSPTRYNPVEPNSAISTLLHRQEQKLNAFRKRSSSLVGRLRQLRVPTGVQPGRRNDRDAGGTYKLVVGQPRYINELRRLIEGAQHEVLRIISAGGVIRTFMADMDETYLRASARGVSVRMITEVNSQNTKYVKRLSKGVRIRHLDAVRLRFTVIDNSVAVLAARFDENAMTLDDPTNSYLVFNDPKLAEAFCFFFEHLWSAAKPFSQGR